MTAHEALTSLVWLVAGGYTLYLVWFLIRSMKDHANSTDSSHK